MSEVPEIPVIEDPLADALRALRMDGLFYCPSELTSPWGVDLPVMEGCLWFHVITAGTCTVRGADGREHTCLLYTSPSPRDRTRSRMPSSA